MLSTGLLLRRIFGLSLLVVCGPAFAQTVRVGIAGPTARPVASTGVRTILNDTGFADFDGLVTSATFGWSAAPCPGAVKIKFFRSTDIAPTNDVLYDLVAERGPFDVPPLGDPPVPFPELFLKTVVLSPPVAVLRGDVIAITNLTSCGGPMFSPLGKDEFGLSALSYSGDVMSRVNVLGITRLPNPVVLSATGPSLALGLLRDRFAVTLTAMDPRTHATASGVPVRLGDGAGYFSLPDFTGDPAFPEVTVKMVDATGSPALGGNFWFFYAPLTDVQFVITLEDRETETFWTYINDAAKGGMLCGAADTSLFPTFLPR